MSLWISIYAWNTRKTRAFQKKCSPTTLIVKHHEMKAVYLVQQNSMNWFKAVTVTSIFTISNDFVERMVSCKNVFVPLPPISYSVVCRQFLPIHLESYESILKALRPFFWTVSYAHIITGYFQLTLFSDHSFPSTSLDISHCTTLWKWYDVGFLAAFATTP